MAKKPVDVPISLRIDEPSFGRPYNHLFPGDDDDHGAVIAAGWRMVPAEPGCWIVMFFWPLIGWIMSPWDEGLWGA